MSNRITNSTKSVGIRLDMALKSGKTASATFQSMIPIVKGWDELPNSIWGRLTSGGYKHNGTYRNYNDNEQEMTRYLEASKRCGFYRAGNSLIPCEAVESMSVSHFEYEPPIEDVVCQSDRSL